jgi:hypothetical protein
MYTEQGSPSNSHEIPVREVGELGSYKKLGLYNMADAATGHMEPGRRLPLSNLLGGVILTVPRLREAEAEAETDPDLACYMPDCDEARTLVASTIGLHLQDMGEPRNEAAEPYPDVYYELERAGRQAGQAVLNATRKASHNVVGGLGVFARENSDPVTRIFVSPHFLFSLDTHVRNCRTALAGAQAAFFGNSNANRGLHGPDAERHSTVADVAKNYTLEMGQTAAANFIKKPIHAKKEPLLGTLARLSMAQTPEREDVLPDTVAWAGLRILQVA